MDSVVALAEHESRAGVVSKEKTLQLMIERLTPTANADRQLAEI